MQGTPVSARTRRARARTQRDPAAPTRATSVNDETVETAARTAPRRRTVTPPPSAAPAPRRPSRSLLGHPQILSWFAIHLAAFGCPGVQ